MHSVNVEPSSVALTIRFFLDRLEPLANTESSYKLNPSVSATVLNLGVLCTPEFIELVLSGLCQINCDALWEGYYVCVGK